MASKTIDVDGAIDVGKRALALLVAHAARLADRLEGDEEARLRAVVDLLERGKSAIPGVRFEKSGATLSERQAATELAGDIMRAREVVKAKASTPALKTKLKSFGVGMAVDDGQTWTVVAGAEKFASGCVELEASLRAFGLKPRDGRALATKALQLKAADTSQKTKQGESKNATAARDQAIETAYLLAWQIGSAGALEFSPSGSDAAAGEAPDGTVRAEFEALVADAVVPSDRERGKRAPKTATPKS